MTVHPRPYEAFYIVKPALSDSEVQKVADRFKGIVEENGGTVDSAAKWDKRRLAYEIKGFREGNYVLMNFTAPPQVPAELNRLMRISDDVLRHIIISLEDGAEVAASPASIAAAAAAEETPIAVATE